MNQLFSQKNNSLIKNIVLMWINYNSDLKLKKIIY